MPPPARLLLQKSIFIILQDLDKSAALPAVINTIKNTEEAVFAEWPPDWIRGPVFSAGPSPSVRPTASLQPRTQLQPHQEITGSPGCALCSFPSQRQVLMNDVTKWGTGFAQRLEDGLEGA